ncbi:MAG: alpha/beta fold hydrolase [Xenococcaceae cyanobacterium]
MNFTTLDQTFTHRTTQANGVQLHYVIGGLGEPVLLWHGFLGTWYCWREIMPALAERYTVIAPDMRGYGDSDKPDRGYDARNLAEDFHQLVAQLEFKKIHLVAHDMGAPPALIYAATYPDEVLSLSYLEEPVLLQQHLQQIFKFTPSTMHQGGLWWWTFFLTKNLPETLVSKHEREFLTHFYTQYCYDSNAISADVVDEYLRTFAAPGGVSGALGVYRAIFESIEQTEPFVQNKIQTPILALGGDRSLGDRVKTTMQSLATNVRGGTIERCGHFIAEERPDLLLERLFAFFEEVPQMRSSSALA